jgi:hypothetical protein
VVVLPSAPTSTMLAGIDIAFGKKMLVSSTGTPAHQVRGCHCDIAVKLTQGSGGEDGKDSKKGCKHNEREQKGVL